MACNSIVIFLLQPHSIISTYGGERYQQLVNIEPLDRVDLLPEDSRIVILQSAGWKPSS